MEAIVVPPEGLRALLVAEAELGERILRALILRRVALIELGFGGPVLVGALKSPDVTRLSHFLERNGIPFRVVDPDEDPDASALSRASPRRRRAPLAVLPDGTVLKTLRSRSWPGPWALWRRASAPNRTTSSSSARVRPGLRPRSTAHRRASPSWCWKRRRLEGGRAPARAWRTIWVFRPASLGRPLLDGTCGPLAQHLGAEFSLSTEVTRLDCTSERSGPDPVHVLELADGRRVRARAVVVATGARYRRPEIPNLAQFEGRGVSYWASPVEARLCRNEDVALVGGGNSAGQAAVFLASHARHVRVLVRGPGLSSAIVIGEGAAVVAQLHTFLARRDPAATSAMRATARTSSAHPTD